MCHTFGKQQLINASVMKDMGKTKYRTANMIIQNILEEILRADINRMLVIKGIVKSQLIKNCGLKPSTANKYLKKMENADYIESHKEPWGEREITVYKITAKGKERYEWFVKINAELE